MSERRPRGRPRTVEPGPDQGGVKALDRAMAVLEALSGHEGIGLSALAHETGQAPATLYRILTTLQGRGVAEFDEAEQSWHVGPRAFLIGSAFLRRTSIVERGRPVMRALMQATGETANLGVERGDSVLFVSQVETHASIRAFFPPGTQSPLHASGIGKALLAQHPESRVAELARRGALERFTDHTLTDPAELLDDLRRGRARGYAVDDEERTEGMRCIAAAVFNAYGEPVGGISVSGPSSRVTPAQDDLLGAHVAEAAARLSAALGAPARRAAGA